MRCMCCVLCVRLLSVGGPSSLRGSSTGFGPTGMGHLSLQPLTHACTLLDSALFLAPLPTHTHLHREPRPAAPAPAPAGPSVASQPSPTAAAPKPPVPPPPRPRAADTAAAGGSIAAVQAVPPVPLVGYESAPMYQESMLWSSFQRHSGPAFVVQGPA